MVRKKTSGLFDLGSRDARDDDTKLVRAYITYARTCQLVDKRGICFLVFFFFVESLPAQSDQKSLKYQSGEEGRKILIVDFETNHLPRPFFYLISINPLFRSSQTSW